MDIQGTKWRNHYSDTLLRYRSQAHFIENAYSFGGRRIGVQFEDKDHANASVCIVDDGYSIQISSCFPYALKALFSRLLSDPSVLPWVSSDGVARLGNFEIFYSLSFAKIGEQRFDNVETSVERERIALLLSDIAMEFVFLHEVAHILCGHTDAKFNLDSNDFKITELSLTRSRGSGVIDRNRAWECEADLIGANLLKTYVSTVIRQAETEELGGNKTNLFGPKQVRAETCISFTLLALYVLFRFLRETSDQLNLVGFYPDPLVRAHSVRGALHQSISAQHPLDLDVLDEMTIDRIAECSTVLNKMGMTSGITTYDDEPHLLHGALEKLMENRNKHAVALKPFRFFNWD